MDRFAKIFNDFEKSSILYVWVGSEYASVVITE